MLPGNIEQEIAQILNKYGHHAWLRTEECAKLYSGENPSKRTKFYRWRIKVENGLIPSFQVIKLPNNTSFIGLDSASPVFLKQAQNTNQLKTCENNSQGRGGYFERRAIRKQQEKDLKIRKYEAMIKIILERNEVKKKKKLTVEEKYAIEKKWRNRYGLD